MIIIIKKKNQHITLLFIEDKNMLTLACALEIKHY